MTIEEEVAAYLKGAIVPDCFDMYFRQTPIPMLGNRTWERAIEDGDEPALRKGLAYLQEVLGEE